MREKKSLTDISFSLKDIVLIGAVLFCIWLYFNPFNNSSIKSLEEANAEKDKKIAQIKTERDSLKNERLITDHKIDSLKKVQLLSEETISRLKSESKSKDLEIKDLREDLKGFDDMINENDKKINDLKKNPIKLPKGKLVEKLSQKL
jgi:hypothetical protein